MKTTATESNGSKGKQRQAKETKARNCPTLPLFLLLLLLPLLSFAAFDDLGAGARAPGMGNAFVAVSDDVYAVFYNPGGLANVERPQLGLAYSPLFTGLSDNSSLGLSQVVFAYPLGLLRQEGSPAQRGSIYRRMQSLASMGTLAIAWQRFSLTDIYDESSIFLSFGKLVWQDKIWGSIMAGGNIKRLTRSFGVGLAALTATGDISHDPVLAGSRSKSILDADIGFLLRTHRRWSVGFAVKHILSPDVAFSGNDKERLPLDFRLGAGYKSLWMNLTSELRLKSFMGGKNDTHLLIGAERYFPTLTQGQFGVRGSLGIGSRQFRQATAGFSYRFKRVQIDYGFVMPLSLISDTAGTHRMGLTFYFGDPTSKEEYSAKLWRKIAQMEKSPRLEFGYEFESLLKERLAAGTTALIDPLLQAVKDVKFSAVKSSIETGEYETARQRFGDYLQGRAPQASLTAFSRRLEEVAAFYPTLPLPPPSPIRGEEKRAGEWVKALAQGIKNFLYGRGRAAVQKVSYARSLNPDNLKLKAFLEKLEEIRGFNARQLLVESKLLQSMRAFQADRLDETIRLCQEILTMEQGNSAVWTRLGAVYYLQKKFSDAIKAWERAGEFVRDTKKKRVLEYFLARAGENIKVMRPKVAPPPKPRPGPDPREIERLYQEGVELYAAGEYAGAGEAFQKILKLDPGNVQAKRALHRLKVEYKGAKIK